MKTLNSKQKEMQVFLEENSIIGFAGSVDVYDSKIYVDTRTGQGYDQVIQKLDKLISYLATKYRFPGFTFEDGRQHVVVHILEGIPKFDPRKNVKLSTFIQMRVSRRLINELRNESRHAKNATMLNVQAYTFTCECNYSETIVVNVGEDVDGECAQCGKMFSKAKKTAITPNEIPISSYARCDFMGNAQAEERGSDMSLEFSEENEFLQMQNYRSSMDENIIKSHDIQKWLSTEEPLVVKIVKLICLHDYSIKAAAEKVGISGAWANIKLKNLKNKNIVKEIFGRV